MGLMMDRLAIAVKLAMTDNDGWLKKTYCHDEVLEIARAVLEELREPTVEMISAVECDSDIQNGLDDCNKHDIPYKAWSLMIDAALKP